MNYSSFLKRKRIVVWTCVHNRDNDHYHLARVSYVDQKPVVVLHNPGFFSTESISFKVIMSWKFVYSVFCGVLFFELSRSNKHLTLLLSTSLTHNTDFWLQCTTSMYYLFCDKYLKNRTPQKTPERALHHKRHYTAKDTTPQKTPCTKCQLWSALFQQSSKCKSVVFVTRKWP